jgi:hypothetical protein
MIGIPGGTEIAEVAGSAISAETEKDALCSVFVAALTLNSCVRAPKRKPVFVPVGFFLDAKPSENTVASITIASHQAPVNVRMTFSALCADIRKHQLYMTLFACDFRMHSLKRVARASMIEIGRWEDRFPASCGVAFFAWYLDRSMRIIRPGFGPLRRACGANAPHGSAHDQKKQYLDTKKMKCFCHG